MFTDCSTRITVTPCVVELPHDRRAAARPRAGARPSDSSSIISTFGLARNAIASASICCWPPDSCAAGSFIRLRSAGKRSSTCSVAALTYALVATVHPHARPCRFSATVSDGNTPRPPGTWMTPARRPCAGARPLMSTPSRLMLPRSGRDETRRRRAAPSTSRRRSCRAARSSRRADLEADAEQHLHLPVRDVDRPQAEQVGRAAAQRQVGVREVVDIGDRARRGTTKDRRTVPLRRVAVDRDRDRGAWPAREQLGIAPTSATSDGTTMPRRRATQRSQRRARGRAREPRPPGSSHSTRMRPMPLPANWNRKRNRSGTRRRTTRCSSGTPRRGSRRAPSRGRRRPPW